MDVMSSLRKALRVGQSLVAVETCDAELFASVLQKHLPDSVAEAPSMPHKKTRGVPVKFDTWDCVRGMVSSRGQSLKMPADAVMLEDLVKSMHANASAGNVVVCLDPATWLKDPITLQRLRLYRDRPGMLVMAGRVHEVLKSNHMDDYFLMLSDDSLSLALAEDLVGDYCSEKSIDQADGAPAAIVGMPPRKAVCALEMATWSAESGGVELDVDQLKDGQRERIDATPGLSMLPLVDSGFDSLVGFERLKHLCSVVFEGRKPPGAVVWLDEIEKQLGGSRSDTSGVSQDQLGSILGWMESNAADGVILVGHSGTAKSHFARALTAEFQVDGVRLDLGAAKGSLVGQSENRIRDALDAIEGLSPRTFWVATSNWLESVPQELRRRFRLGTWFVDMPTREELRQLWAMHCELHGLSAMDVPGALMKRNLTGAEVRTICDLAWRGGISFSEAAEFVSPIAEGLGGEEVTKLRSLAINTYLDVSTGKKYAGAV